ncbi:MAG: hypothetical protein Q4D98_06410 [Planctomycetia bacterium]|nr:hypothetical protein [Planctomycetia bacterium]
MEVTHVSLSEQGQLWLNLILLWMGMAVLVGILARWMVPGKPLSLFATLLLGMVSATLGGYVMRQFFLTVWGTNDFNPISFPGILAGVLVASLLLGFWRAVAYFLRFEKK